MKRKPSGDALLSYLLGLALLIFASGITFAFAEPIALLIGLIGLCLLWILGVQRDLYGEDSE